MSLLQTTSEHCPHRLLLRDMVGSHGYTVLLAGRATAKARRGDSPADASPLKAYTHTHRSEGYRTPAQKGMTVPKACVYDNFV